MSDMFPSQALPPHNHTLCHDWALNQICPGNGWWLGLVVTWPRGDLASWCMPCGRCYSTSISSSGHRMVTSALKVSLVVTHKVGMWKSSALLFNPKWICLFCVALYSLPSCLLVYVTCHGRNVLLDQAPMVNRSALNTLPLSLSAVIIGWAQSQ